MDILIIIILIAVLYLILDGGRILDTKLSMNDVLMAKLFRWRKKVEYNGITFYLRVVSDATVEDARKQSLLASRKMRKQLRDDTSDEYLIYLDQYNDLTKEELSAYVQIVASRDVMRDYISNNPRSQLDALPDHPTQEQQEELEAARIQRDLEYVEHMQEAVEAWRVDFEKRLDTMTPETIIKLAKKYRTDELCEGMFNREFESYVVASSIYADDRYTKRMMSVENYRQLPTEVQQILYDAYNTMNVPADEIKNS